MDRNDLETWVQDLCVMASAERVALKKHCVLRMRERQISVDELKEALSRCELVEFYEEDYPFPSALVLGYTTSKRPLHAVVALDREGRMVWVVTLYEPDQAQWDDGFRNRRK